MRRSGGFPLAVVAAWLTAVLVTGCGVTAQDTSEPVTTVAPSVSPPGEDEGSSGPRLTVFFVRGSQLAPVQRRISAATPAAALDQVTEGPTRTEAAGGIRTALPPEVVGIDTLAPPGVVTVSVTRGFTGITGGNQLLAVAQIVWTLTDLPAVDRVRFTVDGVAVEVPTDAGLSAASVDRDDFGSVAPEEPAPGDPPGSTAPADGGTPAGTTPAG